jgi:H+/Cl- antiporter ClcA
VDVPGDLTVHAGAKARRGSGWYEALARVGLVAKGVSYALVGVLALKLALGDGGHATSRTGALQDVARHSFGKFLLCALAAGFAAYALWRLIEGFASREDDAKKKWGKRVACVGRAAIYGTLTFSALKIVIGAGGSGSQNQKAHKTSAMVLAWPGGQWIVGIAGLVVLCVGFAQFYRAITRDFADRWHGATGTARRWGERVGVVGHSARGIVFGLIGVFVIKAALDYNPKDAIGLDGALQKLAHASYGPWLLGVTAAGLVCYALYCFVDARYRDVSA